MELKEFVSETLTQIIEGVNAAQEKAKDTKAIIAPDTINFGNMRYRREVDYIDFDVAITTTDTTEGKTGAGIFIAPISIGGQVRGEISNQTLSHIKFRVPILLQSVADDLKKL